MSQIEEFANLPTVTITGAETLEETIAQCRELYAKFDKELNGNSSEYTLARCNVANLVLLTMAHRFHHQMEYTDAWGRAELLPTSTGAALDNLASPSSRRAWVEIAPRRRSHPPAAPYPPHNPPSSKAAEEVRE